MKKNINGCIFELNEWLITRPYAKYIDNPKVDTFITYNEAQDLYSVNGKKDKDIGEIHCAIGSLINAIVIYGKFKLDCDNDNLDLEVEEKIFEHIEKILLKYKIKSISLGYNKYIYSIKDKKFKLKGKINKNIEN